MPRFMLDTDTCSQIMKRSHPLVSQRLQSVPGRRPSSTSGVERDTFSVR